MAPPQNATVTSLNGFIERVYPADIVSDDIYKEVPELAIANKVNFPGDRYVVKVKYAGQVGRSASYANAVTNRTSSQAAEFLITDSDDFATGGVDNKAILTVADNKNDYKKLVDREMDSTKTAMVRSFGTAFHAADNGSLGRIVAIAGAVITIAVENQKNFYIGQILNASSSPSLGAPDRVATAEVIQFDRITGILTAFAAPALWAIGDYLYQQGDYRARPAGFLQFAPKTVTATAFFGVNRTLARLELAGSYYDGSKGASTDEVLQDAFAYAGDLGQDIDTGFMNPIRFNALSKALVDRSLFSVGLVGSPDRPKIGFKSIQFVGPKGNMVDIIPSIWCPRTTSPFFKRSDLTVAYRGKSIGKTFPSITDFDGMKVRRARLNENVTEWEMFAHWCIAIENPMNLMNVEF